MPKDATMQTLKWTNEGKAITAICWIAVGLIFLPINFNLIRPEMLAQLWKLWPFVPITAGVATLLSIGRPPWSIAKNE